MLEILVILGSTRQNRAGEQVARWVVQRAKNQSQWVSDFVDLRDYPLAFYDHPQPPVVHREVYTNPLAQAFVGKVARADGYIWVTPEYNHVPPAVLINAIDYAYWEWVHKPVAFVSYSGGAIGGARAVEVLRLLAIELQMAPLRDAVHIGQVHEAFDGEDGRTRNELYERRLTVLMEQLTWWAEALKAQRERTSSARS